MMYRGGLGTVRRQGAIVTGRGTLTNDFHNTGAGDKAMGNFTTDNTEGFTAADCETLNAAVALLVAGGWDADGAGDAVNNAWLEDATRNTVELLVSRAYKLDSIDYRDWHG